LLWQGGEEESMAGKPTQLVFAIGFVFGCNHATSNEPATLADIIQSETPPPGVAVSDRPRAAYIIRHHEGPVQVYDGTQRIIFVNGQGGHYTAGNNEDSRTNVSSIASSSVDMPAYSKGAAAWQQFMTCIRDQYSPFNVLVTDQDPGNVPHLEAVISGSPDMIGLGGGVGGIANMNDDCSLFENGITWIFEQVFRDAQTDCEVAAQEISHNIGLDHEYLCEDPMTYLDGCGNKRFRDQDVRCGEYSPRNCMCADPRNGSATNQNSVQFMLGRLGPAGSGTGGSGGGTGGAGGTGGTGGSGGSGGGGGDMIPPTVAISEPADGTKVPLSFDIKVDASDNSGTVQQIEFLADGQSLGAITAPPWVFTVPANRLSEGAHVLSAKAYDPTNNTATSQVVHVTVEKQSGGSGGAGGGNPGASGDVNGGCGVMPGAGGGAWLLLLFGLALLRRRK
jgi:MYXO-CTERM domain-containing protein